MSVWYLQFGDFLEESFRFSLSKRPHDDYYLMKEA